MNHANASVSRAGSALSIPESSDPARGLTTAGIVLLVAALCLGACKGEEAIVQQEAVANGSQSAAPGGSPVTEIPSGDSSSAAADATGSVQQARAYGPLQLGFSAAADYSPVYPTSVLPAPTKRVTIVFRFDEANRYEQLTGTLVAIDIGAAAPPGTRVGSTAITVRSTDRGALDYTSPRPFPPGRYRLDVTADTQVWNSLEFEVASTPGGEVPSWADLMPLTPGTTWTYDLSIRAGAGVKMNIPENLVGADGVFRATATQSITGAEEAGAHVEMRRDGELQTEEWWRADERGISSTRSREAGELTILDPPRPVFPLPSDLPREWEYAMRDGSFKLQYRMWGPLPVRGPSGEAPGYLIFVKHDGPAVTTVERHFIPGIGMTKEVVIVGVNGQMMSRQEMVLRGVELARGPAR